MFDKEILVRTGYSFDKTPGQHKYGGPPPNYSGEEPGSGHEVSGYLYNFFRHCFTVI